MSDQDHNQTEDPYGQTKPKRGQPEIYVSYRTKAIWALLGYFLFWIVGFIMTLAYLNQARNDKDRGYQVEGTGCLWLLLFVEGLLVIMVLFMIFVVGPAVENVFQNIVWEIR